MSPDLGRRDEVTRTEIGPPPEAPGRVRPASSQVMEILSGLNVLVMWTLWGLGLGMLLMMASLPLLEWLAQGPDRATR